MRSIDEDKAIQEIQQRILDIQEVFRWHDGDSDTAVRMRAKMSGLEDALEIIKSSCTVDKAQEAAGTEAEMMDIEKLLPCPFCGGQAILIGISKGRFFRKSRYAIDESGADGFFIKCIGCRCDTGISLTKEEAIKTWSKRAEAEQQAREPIACGDYYKCPECGFEELTLVPYGKLNYCPKCGQKLKQRWD